MCVRGMVLLYYITIYILKISISSYSSIKVLKINKLKCIMAKNVVTAVSEDQLQSQLWKWAWNTYPEHRGKMWAVPNGAIGAIVSKKDMIQAQKMEATGLLKGVWDLHVFVDNKFHIIETKFGNNRLSKEQIWWGEIMESNGAGRYVYCTLEQGQHIYRTIFNILP